MLLVKSRESKSFGKFLSKTGGYLLFPCLALQSADALATQSITNPTSVLSIFLSLLLVVAIIFAVAYLMRRFNVTPGGSGQLRVIASMSAGTRERVMVLQVGDEQHLIGVTAQNINHLSKLETPLTTTSPSTPDTGAAFKQKLVQAMAQKMNPSVKERNDDR
ncbi:flagellar biosynthetic protein FliO [Alteromonas gilva]|uniref:Flagellar protein n=1 Tax=Alteromonas gilva TaxID=2987522 RepID=A0ABT5L248_9ALTE|nr:flagellar biosynthetic protein FliO [Alteromonas gilva]MDC8830499.1 flagellar biosynthetic protein FliO [Alteromonas gilva]